MDKLEKIVSPPLNVKKNKLDNNGSPSLKVKSNKSDKVVSPFFTSERGQVLSDDRLLDVE